MVDKDLCMQESELGLRTILRESRLTVYAGNRLVFSTKDNDQISSYKTLIEDVEKGNVKKEYPNLKEIQDVVSLYIKKPIKKKCRPTDNEMLKILVKHTDKKKK